MVPDNTMSDIGGGGIVNSKMHDGMQCTSLNFEKQISACSNLLLDKTPSICLGLDV
jgi:hypothetical protein